MVYFIAVNGFTPRFIVALVTMCILCILFWYVAVPYIAVKFFKPVSRVKFFIRMMLYAAFLSALYAFWFYAEYKMAEDSFMDETLYAGNIAVAFIVGAAIISFVSAIISYNIFKHTKGVDVALPYDYIRAKTVKAKVTEVDSLTAVEYNQKTYYLSKNFNFRLRDEVKVKLIEDRENCYLA
ncbi:MAG: hypothetical protein IJ062_03265 [Firmicutes bacterium]|nr:hypothetical protein [Bacillota bacterium]